MLYNLSEILKMNKAKRASHMCWFIDRHFMKDENFIHRDNVKDLMLYANAFIVNEDEFDDFLDAALEHVSMNFNGKRF